MPDQCQGFSFPDPEFTQSRMEVKFDRCNEGLNRIEFGLNCFEIAWIQVEMWLSLISVGWLVCCWGFPQQKVRNIVNSWVCCLQWFIEGQPLPHSWTFFAQSCHHTNCWPWISVSRDTTSSQAREWPKYQQYASCAGELISRPRFLWLSAKVLGLALKFPKVKLAAATHPCHSTISSPVLGGTW